MMSRFRQPSPALVIAVIALFVALGGGAYAALRVGSKQIVNNSVRSKDVRNRTLMGRDHALDSLGGRQIDEPKLGRVPRAANAQALEGRRRFNVTPFTLAAGQAREVMREGPFVLAARCRIGVATADGPRDMAEVLIASGAPNAAFDAADSGPIGPGTPEGDRVFVNAVAVPPEVAIDSLQDALALAPDGTEEIVDASLYAAVNALGQRGICRFGGYVDLG
jgi:hypothetical protein